MPAANTDLPVETDRRSLLKAAATLGAAGVTGLAGCSGGGDGNGDGGDGNDSGDDNSIQTQTVAEGEPESLPEGGTLVMGAQQGVQTMSPFRGFLADYLISEAMYDRLTRIDQQLNVHPNLATDWESNSDLTRWTFMLREDATFANMDGQKMRAQDVKATYDFLTSDAFQGSASSLSNVKSVSVVDDTTVEIQLANPDLVFPKRISETGGAFFVVPKSILDEDPSQLEDTDYGTGPLTLTEWNPKNNMRFAASSDYHIDGANGDPLPYVDEIRWTILSDNIQRANALADGTIDAVSRTSPKVADRVQNSATLVKRTSGLQYPIVLNTTVKPLDNPKVRKAIKYALNREQIIKAVAPDAVLGHHAAITPAHTSYNDELPEGDTFGTTANTEKAQQLLEEAGFGDGIQMKTFHYDDGVPAKEVIAQLFQTQMRQIGIEFDINRLTEEKWLSNYWNTDGSWYITNYSTRMLGSTVPRLALRSSGVWNEARWSNEDYDAAYGRAANATNMETRLEALKKMQRINHREGPWVGTFHPKLYGGYKEYVENYELYPTYIKDFISRIAVDK